MPEDASYITEWNSSAHLSACAHALIFLLFQSRSEWCWIQRRLAKQGHRGIPEITGGVNRPKRSEYSVVLFPFGTFQRRLMQVTAPIVCKITVKIYAAENQLIFA